MNTLPTDSAERKEYPMFSGCLTYFPAALAGVAKHSKAGNDKHNPGQEMHHARGKSGDHADCIIRHLTDLADMLARRERRGNELAATKRNDELFTRPILDEVNALAWRALALSQELHELYGGAPLAPGARLPEPVGVGPSEQPLWHVHEPTVDSVTSPAPAPAVTVDPHIVPGPDGWIEHDGTAYSEPADGDMLVQVRLRFDSDASGIGARGVGVPARTFRWNHTGSGGDIIAWRPAQ